MAENALAKGAVQVGLGKLVVTLHAQGRLFGRQFVGMFLDIHGLVAGFTTALSDRIMYHGLGRVFGMTFLSDTGVNLSGRLFHLRLFRPEHIRHAHEDQ